MPYIIGLAVVVAVIALAVTYWPVTLAVVAIGIGAYVIPPAIRNVRKRRYFASEEFLSHKAEIASVVAEHNDVLEYTDRIRGEGRFDLGASATGASAHLATFENTSRYAYRRDRNLASYGDPNVHNCSLQVVRSASQDPIKYLMKYFHIKATEPDVERVEELGDSIARLESAVANLKKRESAIKHAISPPAFILRYFEAEFMQQVGVNLDPVTVPYPEYVFEYVSAGGNSSQRATIKLDSPTIDELIDTMAERIRFRKTAEGQRALMTVRLREFIKSRDNFACCHCGASLAAEPNLLLEVDHVMPLSRGGLSTIDNLQTLCWRCNRSKSNKLPSPE